MLQPQPRESKRRLVFAASAAIMIGGVLLTPHNPSEALGASPQSAKDQWVAVAIQLCEKKNEAGEGTSKAKKLLFYGTTGAADLGGGGGLFSFGFFVLDTLFDITTYKPINCDRTVQNEANKKTWDSPPSSAPAPLDQTPTQVMRPDVPRSSPLLSSPQLVALPLVQTLSEPDRAYIREFKSAMAMRGKQLTRRSRHGNDRGAMHKELVKFMDSVPNDQWDKANKERMAVRLKELAQIDPIVMQESHRILRKVVADFRQAQPVLALSPTSLPPVSTLNSAPNSSAEANRIFEILTQPIPERSLAPGRPVLDNRHEMG